MTQFPNKILLSQDRETGVINDYWVLQDFTDNITKEYIRKDLADSMLQMSSYPSKIDIQKEIFIEKACNLLVNCIEDFMLRRMEIWDEECKKQTLENIRKKLEEI